jgi:hypothetical protein
MVRLSPAGPELPGVRVVRRGEGAATPFGQTTAPLPTTAGISSGVPALGERTPAGESSDGALAASGRIVLLVDQPASASTIRENRRSPPRIPMFGLLPAHQHPRMHSSAGQRIRQPPECNRPRKNAIPPRPDDTDSTETHPQHRDAPVSHDQVNNQGPDPVDQPQGGQVTTQAEALPLRVRCPHGVRLSEPLGVELGCAVDRGQPQRLGTGVGESVGDVGRSNHELPAANAHRVIAELEPGLPRFDHEHLCVGVPVQPRAGTGRRMHQDDRERNVPMRCADELLCVLRMRKIVEAHDRGHLPLLLHATRPGY